MRLGWGGGENINACRIFVVKPEGRIPLEKPKRRWEDNIKTDFEGIEWKGMD
jgi:hypothetical protein